MAEEFNPFQSPQYIETPRSQGYPPPGYPPQDYPPRLLFPFESGHTRAVWAMALLGGMILLCLLYIYSAWLQYDLLDQMRQGKMFPREVLHDNDLRHQSINALVLLGRFITAVPFLMWTHRVYRNLPALGARHLELTPGWAVGWYFVPLVNLVKPYTTTDEIWRHSDPDGIGMNAHGSSTALVGGWWFTYVAGNLIGVVGHFILLGIQGKTIEMLQDATLADIAAKVVTIIAAILAILVIARIDGFQRDRFFKINGQTPSGFGY